MPTRHAHIDRATFLRRASGFAAIALATPAGLLAMPEDSTNLEHPEPREGITSERVLTVAALATVHDAQALDAYDAARTYPAIFDGVACGCSCRRQAREAGSVACGHSERGGQDVRVSELVRGG